MDFFVKNWELVLAVLLSGGFLLFSFLRKSSGSGIPPAVAVSKINHEKAIVVDIRDEESYALGHIVGSRLLTMEQIKAGEFKGLSKNKALPVILICRTGFAAGKAIPHFKEAGYESVFTLDGGIGGWLKAELPLETGVSTVKNKK